MPGIELPPFAERLIERGKGAKTVADVHS